MLDDALVRLAELLPNSWRLHRTAGHVVRGQRFDAIAELTGPGAAKATFAVVGKRSIATSSATTRSALIRQLEDGQAAGLQVLFVSDYIGPKLRNTLSGNGFSFADTTGWVRVASADPLIILAGEGAPRGPRAPRSSAVRRLNGLAANRTVRALASVTPPVGVRDLAGVADVSPGSVSKLLMTLSAEGIVERSENGRVLAVHRRALLRRWAADYSFLETNVSAGYYLAPRGLQRTLARLAGQPDAAITGSVAARQLLPESIVSVVPLQLLAIYAARPAELADQLNVIDADPGTANVVIARPQDPAVLAVADSRPGTVPIPLVIADLLSLPGRSDAEAEQLMDVLAVDDEGWNP